MAVGVCFRGKTAIHFAKREHALKQRQRASQDWATARGPALSLGSPQRGRKGLAMASGPRQLTFFMGEAEYWPSKSNSLSLSRLSPALFLSCRTRDRAFFLEASPEPAPPLPRRGPASAIPALSAYPPRPLWPSGGPGYRRQSLGCLLCYACFAKKRKANRHEIDD